MTRHSRPQARQHAHENAEQDAITISVKCGRVTAMVKPCKSSSRFSIAFPESESRPRRAARHVAASLKHPLEDAIEHERGRHRDRQRLQQRLAPRQRQRCKT